MSSIRLDKYLSNMGVGTRTEVKSYIKKGQVSVNGVLTPKPEQKIDTEEDLVEVNGKAITFTAYEYYMLNKPAGVLSATEDKHCKTVMDLLTIAKRKDLFPVGRLDKDTEGLLLLTNDGELSHQLLSPKNHVSKVYFAKIAGIITEKDIAAFEKGVVIADDFTALPAKLNILSVNETEQISEVEVTVYEGKFHQVKRMFQALNKKVTYLKRISMGSLILDKTLALGEYRPLTTKEYERLKEKC